MANYKLKPGQRGYKPRLNKKPAGQPNADMFSYDNALPCKNPKCKSHGKPHPNCKCYGSKNSLPQKRLTGLAHGGQVPNFCDTEQDHESGCEYFMDGGISAGDVQVDQPAPISSNDIQVDQPSQPTISDHDVELDSDKYGSTEQTVKAGLEGLAQGVAGPVATYAETHLLGVKPEDIAGRQEAHPFIHGASEAAGLAGSMLTGVGEAGLAANLAEHLAPEVLGKVGSSVIKGFITNGIIQGGDEISKSMLGQGDPEAPVSSALVHMGAAGLLGATGGLLGAGASKGLELLEDQKLGSKMASFVHGIGYGAEQAKGTPLAPLEGQFAQHVPSFVDGTKFYQKIPSIVGGASEDVGIMAGEHVMPGFGGALIGRQLGKIIGKPLNGAANKYIIPTALKILSSGKTNNVLNALDYAGQVGRGAQIINKSLESLFDASSQQVYNMSASEKDREKLKKFVSDGTFDKQVQAQLTAPPEQTFESGGVVDHKPQPPATPILQSHPNISEHYPTQDILLQAAKGRINNYLNSVRPLTPVGGMPFDKHVPDKQKERDYDHTLDLANQPLSILNHVKSGALTMEQMKSFTAMYPELHNHLAKEMTKHITQKQLDGDMVPYQTRQAMSMFLGAPLDSTMTPASIQSIQQIYAGNKAAQSAHPKSGSGAKLGKIADNLRTSDQARSERADK